MWAEAGKMDSRVPRHGVMAEKWLEHPRPQGQENEGLSEPRSKESHGEIYKDLLMKVTVILMCSCREGAKGMNSLTSLSFLPLISCQGSSLAKPTRSQRARSPLMWSTQDGRWGHRTGWRGKEKISDTRSMPGTSTCSCAELRCFYST